MLIHRGTSAYAPVACGHPHPELWDDRPRCVTCPDCVLLVTTNCLEAHRVDGAGRDRSQDALVYACWLTRGRSA